MNLLNNEFSSTLTRQKAVKIIAGLNNFDVNYIFKIVKAADIAHATYVDISANPLIISLAKSITSLPICASSIDPKELYKSSIAGANILELGNFDCFYENKIFFSEQQIVKLTQQTIAFVQDKLISVTIPHILPLKRQIRLALNLQDLGVDLLQTEGFSTKLIDNNDRYSIIINHINCASSALSSTYLLTKYSRKPIISASGINLASSPISAYYGASIVGICSALKKYDQICDMVKYIKDIKHSVSSQVDSQLSYRKWQLDTLHMSVDLLALL